MMRKKGMAGQQLLEMILVIILLLVVVYLIWNGVSKPGNKLSKCESTGGSCKDLPCEAYRLQTSNLRCPDEKPNCCIDAEKVFLSDEEPASDKDKEAAPNCLDYPIIYNDDPGYRYTCVGNDNARACNVTSGEPTDPFDACKTTDKKHPVYLQCCQTKA